MGKNRKRFFRISASFAAAKSAVFAACAGARRRPTARLLGFACAFACVFGCALALAQQPARPGAPQPAQPAQPRTPAPNAALPAPAAPVEVAPPDAAGPILTLEECVTRALARGFDLEIEHQSLAIA